MFSESHIFSLVLPGFSIEFDVKREASIVLTYRFGAHAKDFVFAVAEVWFNVESVRHLIESDRHPGNMIETLKGVEADLRNPNAMEGIATLFPQGHWGRWMHGYWDRLMNDAPHADDEARYKQLIPMSAIDGGGGHVAVYLYNGVATLEIATRPSPVYRWTEFDPAHLVRQVRDLREAIAAHVREACASQTKTLR